MTVTRFHIPSRKKGPDPQMEHLSSFELVFRLTRMVGRVALAPVITTLVFSMGGCYSTVRTNYFHTVEMTISDRNGRPVSGVDLYQYGPPYLMNPSPKSASYFAKCESELQGLYPGLLSGVDHHADACGLVVIPIFHTFWDQRPLVVMPLYLIFPYRIEDKVECAGGIIGSECAIVVDNGKHRDIIFVRMQPGVTSKGDHYQIEVRALSPPKTYRLPRE